MTAARLRQSISGFGKLCPCVSKVALRLLAGGAGGTVQPSRHGHFPLWRPRSDTVRGDCGSRSRLNGRLVESPSTSPNPGNALPDDLARQTTRFYASGMHRSNVELQPGYGLTIYQRRKKPTLRCCSLPYGLKVSVLPG